MCGIVGYVGDRDLETVLIVGLERLSYRGYDSSGIAILSQGELSHWKTAGKIHNLEQRLQGLKIDGELGIGQTRWATHGEANDINAHPHLSQDGRIAIVHNGIIENFSILRSKLQKEGFIFRSQTDSEVIVHLIDRYISDTTLEKAVERAVMDLEGAFAIAAICEQDPKKIVVARKGSPLVIGIGKDENFVSSDVNAVLSHTKDVLFLADNEMAVVTKTSVGVKKINGPLVEKKIETIQWDAIASEKGGFDHFMLKEIHEQPSVVRKIISKYTQNDRVVMPYLRNIDPPLLSAISRFIIQACGTSWHAGLYGKYLIEQFVHILTEVDISSEFRYRKMINNGNSVVAALSQSGETADTLACIREAKAKFFSILSFVNVKGSSMDRESDGVVYSHAGQEIGVASTKNFIAQLTTLYLFTIYLGQVRNTLSPKEMHSMIDDLKKIPAHIESILQQSDTIKKMAEKYHLSSEFLFIGRGMNYPSALEGALKLKEISYIHATGYAAGELKHGPIALIDSKLPVVCIAPKTDTYDKMLSNIQEVKARKGKTIIIATEGDAAIQEYADDIIYIPETREDLTPLLVAVPLQLLAYYIAVNLSCDVDQPRNLAKSVTVE